MNSADSTAPWRRFVSIALLILLLAACAPDAWRSDSPYDAFLDQVRIKCWDTRLGSTTIPELMPDAMTTDVYFMDLTSRFYNGQISHPMHPRANAPTDPFVFTSAKLMRASRRHQKGL